ncbi:MAG: hypothetical protein Q8868_06360 [Bacteroidota bacterium]|nr:hypothetical protein [Bacteroidota bacterium]
MKKPLLITLIVLVLILIMPLINFIRWSVQDKMPLDVLILDKTVPTLDRLKHKSLVWILNNDRFVKKQNKSSYSYKKDYYGFSPTRPLRERGMSKNEYHLTEMIDLPQKVDALYFADTYGVFFNDWYAGVNKSRRSRKIYGGLNNTDYLLINEMKNRNKLIILEYNSFDFPTPAFESYRTQEKLGITFSGWTGKYFEKLDSTSKDFPVWMTAMYRKANNKPWTFKKAGVVILDEKNIIVLEEGTQLKSAMPMILTDTANCRKFGIPASVAFNNWFDIINPLQNNVISKFHLETTAAGDTLLSGKDLTASFPAVIQEPVNQRTYYFSGDFASNKISFWTSRIKGCEKLKGLFYSEKPNDTRRFFWLYYRPLINHIFTDYYVSMNSKK